MKCEILANYNYTEKTLKRITQKENAAVRTIFCHSFELIVRKYVLPVWLHSLAPSTLH